MKYLRIVIMTLVLLTSANTWGDVKTKGEISREAKSNAPHISSQQLADYLSGDEKYILLDVRTESEFEAGHIQGAQWFARGRLEYYIQELIRDPDAKIILYCRTGGRSALATLTLLEMGYTDVVDLNGGFKRWIDDGYSIFNLHGESKIITYQKPE